MKVALATAMLSVVVLGFNAIRIFAHGEDSVGPHGGVIRMPGAFHTELKQVDSKTFQLYLLDMEWKDPIVENSKVSVSLVRSGRVVTKLKCNVREVFFECKVNGQKNIVHGDRFLVQASRQGMLGHEVSYAYPLAVGDGGKRNAHH